MPPMAIGVRGKDVWPAWPSTTTPEAGLYTPSVTLILTHDAPGIPYVRARCFVALASVNLLECWYLQPQILSKGRREGMSARRLLKTTLVLCVLHSDARYLWHPERPRAAAPSYTLFESGQVRPLALSPNGQLLFAVNTPDNRLEIFRGAARAGLVARAARCPSASSRSRSRRAATTRSGSSTTSPTASASSMSTQRPRAGRSSRTLLVGDEPRDIVFAGPGAHARLHHHRAPRPEHPVSIRSSPRPASAAPTSGSSTPTTSAASLGGTPLTIVTLFTDTPRALAVTPDGARVYAAGVPLRQPDHGGRRDHRARRRRGRRRRPRAQHQLRGHAAARGQLSS